MHNLSYDKDWELPVNLLVISNLLGEGLFGQMYEGKAYGIDLLKPRNKSRVAKNQRNKLRKIAKKRSVNQNPEILSATVVAVKTVKGLFELKG